MADPRRGRPEDEALVRGAARFSDDCAAEGRLFAWFLRSPFAHAEIGSIDVAGAAAAPGVELALTGEDLDAAGYTRTRCAPPTENAHGETAEPIARPHLASGVARHVGEPVAMVVARTLEQAKDACERIEVDWRPLEPVIGFEAARRAGPPTLDWRWATGGDAEAVERAFASAARIARTRVVDQRLAICPMEPRSMLARYEDGRFVVEAGNQGAHGFRNAIAKTMGLDPSMVRVITPRVGGSFGLKGAMLPEYPPILHAARALGRPIKWTDDRSGAFLSDNHGRAMEAVVELALSEQGDFLALRVEVEADLGAYPTPFGPFMPSTNIVNNTPGPYATPLMEARARCYATNTTPIGPYRGAGRPDGVLFMECAVDAAARASSIDPVALRRRNFISATPARSANERTIDSGDFDGLLSEALARADWDGFEARAEADRARGRARGRGLATYLQVTAGGGEELGEIRFAKDGSVRFVTGTLDYGQGHEASFAPIVAEALGAPLERIVFEQRDSDALALGGGTGGSRSAMASGAAALEASRAVIEAGKHYAARCFEAAIEDVEFERGVFRVRGSDLAVPILELAALARAEPLDAFPDGLDVSLAASVPPATFPNGAHAAEIAIELDTGRATLERFVGIDDFGRILNEPIALGQMHGGIAQGIGQALFEEAFYDASGQLVTGSLMDYHLARAVDVPFFDLGFRGRSATTNALGVKGLGEAGPCAGVAACANALRDALFRLGCDPEALRFPATPQRLWRILEERPKGR